MTRSRMAWQARAHNGAFSEGFQTTGSPQTSARAAFHAQTATGKLNAVMMPTGPIGCHCSISRWPARLARHRGAVELAREPDGEVADIDHLLHFAPTLARHLPDLQGDELAQCLLVTSQLVAEPADELASARRRDRPPDAERALRAVEGAVELLGALRSSPNR